MCPFELVDEVGIHELMVRHKYARNLITLMVQYIASKYGDVLELPAIWIDGGYKGHMPLPHFIRRSETLPPLTAEEREQKEEVQSAWTQACHTIISHIDLTCAPICWCRSL